MRESAHTRWSRFEEWGQRAAAPAKENQAGEVKACAVTIRAVRCGAVQTVWCSFRPPARPRRDAAWAVSLRCAQPLSLFFTLWCFFFFFFKLRMAKPLLFNFFFEFNKLIHFLICCKFDLGWFILICCCCWDLGWFWLSCNIFFCLFVIWVVG